MERVRRFLSNAGFGGSIRTLVLAALGVVLLWKACTSGAWTWSLPVLAAALLISWVLRNVLVDNVDLARVALNTSLIVMLALAVIGRRFLDIEAGWPSIVILAFIGLYMGCYVLLMSDPRIVVRR